MLTSSYHLGVKYPAKISFLWSSAGFFDMLSGEYSADSCSKEQEIGYCVICLSPGPHPDKEQLLMNQVIKWATRCTIEWCSHIGNRSAADQACFIAMGVKILNTIRNSYLGWGGHQSPARGVRWCILPEWIGVITAVSDLILIRSLIFRTTEWVGSPQCLLINFQITFREVLE
jgi:hypothetical protein